MDIYFEQLIFSDHRKRALSTGTGDMYCQLNGCKNDESRGAQIICFLGLSIHETGPALRFGVFCLTKKADSTLLLRVGACTTSRLGLSNDLNAVNGLELSSGSCKRKLL